MRSTVNTLRYRTLHHPHTIPPLLLPSVIEIAVTWNRWIVVGIAPVMLRYAPGSSHAARPPRCAPPRTPLVGAATPRSPTSPSAAA